MQSSLAVRALESAVARRGQVAGCVVHSDRGSQPRLNRLVEGFGWCLPAECFAGPAVECQSNVLDHRTWATRQELRIAIVTWIERPYHRRRRQKRLARLTPVEYETIMTPPAALAA